MESRFPQRVQLERHAIDLVNRKFSGASGPLVGLSSATVDAWISKLIGYDSSCVANLKLAINLVALAARSEADVSDEIFVDINDAEAGVAIDRIKEALSAIRF